MTHGTTAVTYPLTITGAVLRESGTAAPYAESRPLRIEQMTLDAPGPHEVLIEIEAAGLCHSDLSVINGSRPRPLPMLLGHEAAGIVHDVGSDVTDLHQGQRVVMVFLPRCGECAGCATDGRRPCERGSAANGAGTLMDGGLRLHAPGDQVRHHLGVSGFATYAVVDRRSVVAVDDDVPADVAAILGCAMLTGGGAVLNVRRPSPDESVAVVGLGGVGMAALITAKAIGVERLVAIDHLPEKLTRATELGATHTYTPGEAADQGITTDLVIEAAGHARAFETAVAVTGAGGTMVTVGLPAPGATSSIEPLAITAAAKSIVGSYLGSAVPERDIPLFVDLWRTGRLDVKALVSSYITLEDVNEAMDSLDAGHAIRQVITF
ncbi:alcohol dehydrogenase catalytic domain-containing protein [Nocardioides sp. NPDC006303]|uniref:alcohol dehydrogenase catalytic domain-containing protein n=1 Tax=Nocardioides sp. NPDC006303 TaxID=3156747 RepID=UPI0033BCF0AB